MSLLDELKKTREAEMSKIKAKECEDDLKESYSEKTLQILNDIYDSFVEEIKSSFALDVNQFKKKIDIYSFFSSPNRSYVQLYPDFFIEKFKKDKIEMKFKSSRYVVFYLPQYLL